MDSHFERRQLVNEDNPCLSIPLNGFEISETLAKHGIPVTLSIPLNGFSKLVDELEECIKKAFNSIEWILQVYVVREAPGGELHFQFH